VVFRKKIGTARQHRMRSQHHGSETLSRLTLCVFLGHVLVFQASRNHLVNRRRVRAGQQANVAREGLSHCKKATLDRVEILVVARVSFFGHFFESKGWLVLTLLHLGANVAAPFVGKRGVRKFFCVFFPLDSLRLRP
jgi:hypothetical protein